MKKYNEFDDSTVNKYFILTRPTKLSDMSFEDIDLETEPGWRQKSKQLQARRWRKIRHQLV